MDQCRWVLGQNELPKRVISFGGRFGFDDDGETPNSQIAIFDYEPAPLIFEVQGLPAKKGDTAMGNFKGVRVGLVVICEEGYFAGGGGGRFSGQGHVEYSKGTPLCNLYLTMLEQAGVSEERFGDSTGKLSGLA